MAKTSTAQRTASFNDTPEGAFMATERVFKMLSVTDVKIHAIVAEVQDLWFASLIHLLKIWSLTRSCCRSRPKPLSKEILGNIAKVQAQGMGVTVIKGVGHHVRALSHLICLTRSYLCRHRTRTPKRQEKSYMMHCADIVRHLSRVYKEAMQSSAAFVQSFLCKFLHDV